MKGHIMYTNLMMKAMIMKGDILLYRSGNEDYVLYASIRTNSSFKQSEWQGLF